ncbi:MerR family transcriptional regulator [Nicoliella spurrieriana]|uniref:MerR family transcriptional regulator n=1 Tax=Nicoliella spurrieriana TaxID=2925830 RepID=A0A976RSQ1_9LACO|nr:MerR family transcriptional regulator [Nicoliella spurrieriana]UQS87084.1 MerR family transcriptional regulator [Nicoliella spurrieriana]
MDGKANSFSEISSHLFEMFKRDDFSFGIGDIANYAKIPQSKLRYWEKCGYIKSEKCSRNQNRKYSYHTLMKVQLIKSYLESGFTLSKAAEKAAQFTSYNLILVNMIKRRIKEIGTIDGCPAINMGPLEDDPTKSIYFIDDNSNIKALIKNNE